VVNAILWSAGVEVPKGGAPVKMDPEEVNRNLDGKVVKVPIENRTKETITFRLGAAEHTMKAGEKSAVSHRLGAGRFRVTVAWPGDKDRKPATFDLALNSKYAFVQEKGQFAFVKQ
jgi:hypothetical protein